MNKKELALLNKRLAKSEQEFAKLIGTAFSELFKDVPELISKTNELSRAYEELDVQIKKLHQNIAQATINEVISDKRFSQLDEKAITEKLINGFESQKQKNREK
jgi:hypothetical protein